MTTFFTDLIYSALPSSSYLTYHRGTSNLILSAPHGGNIKPFYFPSRSSGNRSRDTYTRRLTKEIANTVGIDPYWVVADIHRSRVDLNRDIKEGAQGNKRAERIWTHWNTLIKRYTSDIRHIYGKGLYIDIHSHNSSDEFHIGYSLTAEQYRKIMMKENVKGSSLDSLGKPLYDMIEGTRSFGSSLNLHGFKVFLPREENRYFTGGWNINKNSGGGIGSIQIEVPISVVKKEFFGVTVALSSAIQEFRQAFV